MKKYLPETLMIIGLTLIIAKAADHFISGKSLIPGLTLTGLILVTTSLIMKNKK